MPDILQLGSSLVQTFSTKKKPLSPVIAIDNEVKKNASRSAELPVLDFSIPPENQKALEDARALAYQQNLDAQNRNELLLDGLKTQGEVDKDARNKIETTGNNIFGGFLGMFDDDYDVSFQKKRMQDATNSVITQAKINQIEDSNDALELQNASAEFMAFSKDAAFKDTRMASKMAELNLISKSVVVKEQYNEAQYAAIPLKEIYNAASTGVYDDVMTSQRVRATILQDKRAERLARATTESSKSADLKYKQDLEKDALNTFSLQLLSDRLQKGYKGNPNLVELPGGLVVNRTKVLKEIQARQDVHTEMRKRNVELAIKTAENDPAWNKVFRETQMLTNDYFEGAVDQDISKVNSMNLTDEFIANIDPNKIHPELQDKTMDLVRYNQFLKTKTVLTKQDVDLQEAKLKAYQTEVDRIKQRAIDEEPTKEGKAWVTEWQNNGGRMKSGNNAASNWIANATIMPVGLSVAEEKSWLFAQKNYAEQLGGTSIDFSKLTPKQQQQVAMESITKSMTSRKKTDPQMALLAFKKTNANGHTPKSIYTNIQSADIIRHTVGKLAEENSAVKSALFNPNGTPSAGWSSQGKLDYQSLGRILAQISADDLNKGSTKILNHLNISLQDKINEILQLNAKMWNSQPNINAGSFKALMLGGETAKDAVDRTIQTQYGDHINGFWQAQVQEAEAIEAEEDFYEDDFDM